MELYNQPSAISKLPDEVFMEIFGFLHDGNKAKSDLMNATIVCKKWNRIISESPRLMDKVKLRIDAIMKLATVDDCIVKRPYRHAILEDFNEVNFEPRLQIAEIVLKFASLKSLTTVEFSNMKVAPTIVEILSLCKSLKSMIIKECWHEGEFERSGSIEQYNFLNLRKLKIISRHPVQNSLIDVLPHLKCKNLHSFTIEMLSFDSINNVVAANVFGFLNQLDNCDQIEMQMSAWNFKQMKQLIFEPKFLWSKLMLTYCGLDLQQSAAAAVCDN